MALTPPPSLCRKGPGGLGGHQLDHESAMCLVAFLANSTQVCLRKSHQIRGGDSSPPLGTGEPSPGVLGPVLASLVQKRYGTTGESPEKGH